MNIKQYIWALPFSIFILGYFFLNLLISGPNIDAPNLIGKSASEALVMASNNNLSIKIIGEKEDVDLPEGTVLHQTPINQKVKRNQALYVLISKKPPQKITPMLLHKTESEIEKILSKQNLKAKKYYLHNSPPYCFCQYPEAGSNVDKESIVVYINSRGLKPRLFPNLKGETLEAVQEFLQKHGLKIKVFRKGKEEEEYNPNSVVVKQKPIAGSIVNLKGLSTVLVEVN